MSRTPKKVSIGIVEFALPVPRRGSLDALSGFGSGPQIGAEIHQRVQARRRRENPLQRALRGLEVGVQRNPGSRGRGRVRGIFCSDGVQAYGVAVISAM